MRLLLLAISSLAIAGTAFADPIEDREAIMKERAGLVGALSKVVKGEEAFDAAKVAETLAALHANAEKLDIDALFPAGSGEGKTRAAPAIWEDMAGFKAANEKYVADVAAAVGAAPQDVQGLEPQFRAIGANCGTCHQTYRLSQN